MPPPALPPGWSVRRPLPGATRPAWLVRDPAGALLVARLATGTAALPAAAAGAPLAGTRCLPERGLALTPFAPGGGLDRLLRRRGPLDDDEAVDVAGTLVAALRALHAAGARHPRLHAGSVLLASGGRVVLDDAPLVVAGPGPGSDDLAALAAVLRAAAPGSVAAGLLGDAADAGAVDLTGLAGALAGLASRPVRRYGDLAGVGPLRREPATATSGGPPGGPQAVLGALRAARGTRATGAHAAARVAVLAGVALLVVVAARAVEHRGGSGAAARSAQPALTAKAPAPPAAAGPRAVRARGEAAVTGDPRGLGVRSVGGAGWPAVVSALDGGWAAALAQGSTAALAVVDVPGSAQARTDGALLAALRARGLRAAGLRLVLRSVRPVRRQGQLVVLAVCDTRPAYWLLDAGGRVVAREPARAASAWRLSLAPAPTPLGWAVDATVAAVGCA